MNLILDRSESSIEMSHEPRCGLVDAQWLADTSTNTCPVVESSLMLLEAARTITFDETTPPSDYNTDGANKQLTNPDEPSRNSALDYGSDYRLRVHTRAKFRCKGGASPELPELARIGEPSACRVPVYPGNYTTTSSAVLCRRGEVSGGLNALLGVIDPNKRDS
ncbi:hypothetical protein ACEPAH_129 [Sanghuangporus vaninii]